MHVVIYVIYTLSLLELRLKVTRDDKLGMCFEHALYLDEKGKSFGNFKPPCELK
jgi:hypothetical protein